MNYSALIGQNTGAAMHAVLGHAIQASEILYLDRM